MTLRVDWRASVSLVGTVVKWLSVPLVFPLLVGLYYGEGISTFVTTMVVAVVVGWSLERVEPDPEMGAREGFLMVALTWFAVSIVGGLPYVIAGNDISLLSAYPYLAVQSGPSTLAHPVNALFESMSGFTTTGATVMGDISFETHSRALLMWRQLTQWLGGMGIVVLAVAILPELSVGGAQLMDAEAPGPGIQKLTPRIAETARALWKAYLGITALEILLLFGLHVLGNVLGTPLAPQMTFYNAVAHGFTTMATGGFSPEARSVEAFSAVVQWVIVPFMIAAGTNFALFWHVLNGNPRRLFEDVEFRFYIGILAVLSAILSVLLYTHQGLVFVPNGPAVAGNIESSIRHATFQLVSIVTTTGYASMDFNTWNSSAQYLMLGAMLIGGCAGSTGGAIKIVRWLVILKSFRRELFTNVHPEAVRPVRLGGRALDERAVRGIYAFTLLYVVIFLVATLLLFLDIERTGPNINTLEAMSAIASTLGNVGPGFQLVGPMNNYLPFSNSAKLLMVVLMWVGRLEIFPVFVLLTSAYWRS
ncbi:Trk system potassium uptake protein TrkH [Haladaptatus paucihalophilus DX253]|uniref:Trk system potassium uptake protein TrkH n=1 Tax=Haladaptatus paucihalophilus DX253 TaxID=797209 RepID=E7QZR9_HALPU|nr:MULTISPECIES: TrkH family potassium uptake protein [Haladaptatus]EFW89813.1 Trk system potassium uptake protein TrkH [Haladaptatus paucihalophilus DX253]GKZ12833.1 potassium transporter TrkH [Haladaptatus sp. T7]SHK55101.1 trk system potassium uptake protein TrkH [Haladaptatus paucihalophilus DX253]